MKNKEKISIYVFVNCYICFNKKFRKIINFLFEQFSEKRDARERFYIKKKNNLCP